MIYASSRMDILGTFGFKESTKATKERPIGRLKNHREYTWKTVPKGLLKLVTEKKIRKKGDHRRALPLGTHALKHTTATQPCIILELSDKACEVHFLLPP